METSKRNREIFALRESGMSCAQIGIQFKLSRSRIDQIYKKEKLKIRDEKNHERAIRGDIQYTFLDALTDTCENSMLCTRIFRCLNRAGIIFEIDNNNDTLDSYSDNSLLSIRNFGTASLIFARKANEQYKKKIKEV